MKLVEKVWVADHSCKSLVNILNFFPFFSFYEFPSFFEIVYKFHVVVSKGDLSYFDFLLYFLLVTQVRHKGQSLFEFDLDVKFELSTFCDRISWVVVVLDEVVVLIFIKIKFYSVVSCRDCFHIKVDIFQFLNHLDVIQVN